MLGFFPWPHHLPCGRVAFQSSSLNMVLSFAVPTHALRVSEATRKVQSGANFMEKSRIQMSGIEELAPIDGDLLCGGAALLIGDSQETD